jgi:lipoprotein-anchoring transpeptidase ErfK/SrfK
MDRRYRKAVLLSSGLIIISLLILVSVLTVISYRSIPGKEMEKARKNIGLLELEFLPPGSEKLFKTATIYYDSAMTSWRAENEKIFFLRRFSEASNYANISYEYSSEALQNLGNEMRDHKNNFESRIDRLSESIEKYDYLCSIIPMDTRWRKTYNEGKMLFQETLLALENDNYKTAENRFSVAEQKINTCHKEAISLVNDYFRNIPHWKRLTEKAIENSGRSKTTLLVIDKFARTCTVYKNGRHNRSFEIELGKNWIGDKKLRGDKSTPEGEYKVIRKKKGGETKYYKALLLNYPNDEDRKRFDDARKRGNISPNSNIGGNIEIHGSGGTGTDWTDGCIALKNSDMDLLYDACATGTIVVIVGSLRSLDEIVR